MPGGGDKQSGVKLQYNCDMKTKPLIFLLALTAINNLSTEKYYDFKNL